MYYIAQYFLTHSGELALGPPLTIVKENELCDLNAEFIKVIFASLLNVLHLQGPIFMNIYVYYIVNHSYQQCFYVDCIVNDSFYLDHTDMNDIHMSQPSNTTVDT